jgi:hypothetical protein
VKSKLASAKQIAWRKKFARMAKSGKFRKSTKSTGKKKESMWVLAQQHFKGDRRGLNEYYHSIFRDDRKKYGMPQKAPNVDTQKEREMSRDRMNQGECIECKRQSVSLRDGRCAMCD